MEQCLPAIALNQSSKVTTVEAEKYPITRLYCLTAEEKSWQPREKAIVSVVGRLKSSLRTKTAKKKQTG